ncbi:MAG TPA: sulfite exporter TauE/SafE family protein [Gaiellaceae bacterium]|nr:sulfite exporter TauE/SafE family protein [Gaiellaceae bacterium]
MRFIAIGLAAGFFSALFGVGGGIVVVPLLILAARFGQRSAMATSLASIGLIAFAGTVSYALRGDVDFRFGLLLGLPAAAGAVAGTALQQRVAGPALSYAFAGLLTAIAVWLLV